MCHLSRISVDQCFNCQTMILISGTTMIFSTILMSGLLSLLVGMPENGASTAKRDPCPWRWSGSLRNPGKAQRSPLLDISSSSSHGLSRNNLKMCRRKGQEHLQFGCRKNHSCIAPWHVIWPSSPCQVQHTFHGEIAWRSVVPQILPLSANLNPPLTLEAKRDLSSVTHDTR